MTQYWNRPAFSYPMERRVDPGDYNFHRSNARLVPWPNYSDLMDWLNASSNYPRITGQESTYPRAMIWALDSAISRVAERCAFEVRLSEPPVEWCVSTTDGLATILSAGVFTVDRVGASVSGSGIEPGTVLEAVASPSSAFLSKVATRTTGEEGVHVCVGPAPSAHCSDAPALVPPEVFMATLMQAGRWLKRQNAVEGVIGSSELGGIIRYSSLDPDIEHQLANHLVYGLG